MYSCSLIFNVLCRIHKTSFYTLVAIQKRHYRTEDWWINVVVSETFVSPWLTRVQFLQKSKRFGTQNKYMVTTPQQQPEEKMFMLTPVVFINVAIMSVESFSVFSFNESSLFPTKPPSFASASLENSDLPDKFTICSSSRQNKCKLSINHGPWG